MENFDYNVLSHIPRFTFWLNAQEIDNWQAPSPIIFGRSPDNLEYNDRDERSIAWLSQQALDSATVQLLFS